MLKLKIYLCVLMLIMLIQLIGDDSNLLFDDSSVALIEITVDADDLIWMYDNVWSDSLHLTEVHFSNQNIDEIVSDVGFRLRGNTSRISYKKSFKLSFNDFFSGREFYGVDKINLNGEHNDPSIIRSKLCWDIYQQIGMKSSREAYAAVYINEMYFGLYANIEHIDDEFLEKNFADASGNLWKCNYLARLNYLGDDPELYKFYNNNSRVYELRTNEEEDDYGELARLIDVLNNTSSGVIADSLEKIVDVAGVLKYFAIDVLTGSWDDYWYGKNNYYIYHEPTADKFHIIPYDYDNTFGVDWMGIDWTERDIYQFRHPDAGRPLADVFMENDQYSNLYTHFLEFYSDEVFNLPVLEDRIDDIKDMITPWAEIDFFRTYDYGFTMDDFHDSYSADSYVNQHIKNGLKEFINLRNASVVEQLEYLDAPPVIYELDHYREGSIYVDASAFSNAGLADVNIEFYAEDNTEPVLYPMSYEPVIGTKLVEEADNWQGIIPSLEDVEYGYFQVRATDVNGQSQVYPRTHRILVQTGILDVEDLVINEFLAVNDSSYADEAGEFDDWLELYNPGAENIDLSGLFLTDNPENLDKWQIPSETIIEVGGYLIFWCDEDQEQGTLHTNFKLSSGGETIIITNLDASTIIDSISFGTQTADISFGRSPDGSDSWMFLTPTPSAENIGTASDEDEILEKVSLNNYPNPFNPETMITFTINQESQIDLSIYNIRGQKIITLNDSKMKSGTHSISWNGRDAANRNVSSGLYLYKLSIDDKETITNKCLLLK